MEVQIPRDEWSDRAKNWMLASGPFTLRRGEKTRLPFVSIELDNPMAPARVYQVREVDGAWVPLKNHKPLPLGEYSIFLRVLSEDAEPAETHVELVHNGREWQFGY